MIVCLKIELRHKSDKTSTYTTDAIHLVDIDTINDNLNQQ
jgi:hypothetical protein